MSNPTLASITAELEAVETAARGRGSLTCDHLAGRIANIRGELQQIAQPQPPAEAQPVDQTFAECLVSEMPAGTVIGDPAWWAGRIARQYAKRTSPPSAPVWDLSCCGGNDETPKSHCMDCPRYPGVPAERPERCQHGVRNPHPCRECEDGPSAPVEVDGGEVEYEFEVWQDNSLQAGGSASDYATAKSDADHYALIYGQDGPVEVRMYVKRQITAPPSAPVGVEGLRRCGRCEREGDSGDCERCGGTGWRRKCADPECAENGCCHGRTCYVSPEEVAALAQQPAAVDDAVATASDRDLLKMVASATGLTWRKDIEEERAAKNVLGLWITNQDGSLGNTAWNPLHSSSDAFHLAVELGISVCVRGDAAATRRAIVHAALAAQQGGES